MNRNKKKILYLTDFRRDFLKSDDITNGINMKYFRFYLFYTILCVNQIIIVILNGRIIFNLIYVIIGFTCFILDPYYLEYAWRFFRPFLYFQRHFLIITKIMCLNREELFKKKLTLK